MATTLLTGNPAEPFRPHETRAQRVVKTLAVLAVVSLVLAMALLSFPVQKNDTANVVDFSSFYCAAQIVRQGLGRDLYDLRTQVEFQLKVASVHAFYNHPPYEALLFVPLTHFTYHTAYIIWTFVSVLLLTVAALLIKSHAKISLAISQYVRLPGDLGLVLVLFITFAPATTCLLLGENSMLTLLIFTAVFVLLKRGSEDFAGCVLALGLYKPQFILPFVVILLFRRKWTVIRGFAVVAFLLALVSIGISGLKVITTYPRFLFFDSTYQKVAGFNPKYMPNIRGLLYLALDGRLGKPVFAFLVASFSLSVLWIAAKSWRDEEIGLSFSAALLATLLASYHLYNYDLVLLLLPIAILCGELAARGRLLSSTALNLTLIALFIPPLHRLLLLHNLFGLMCVPVIMLLMITIRSSRDVRSMSGFAVTPVAVGG